MNPMHEPYHIFQRPDVILFMQENIATVPNLLSLGRIVISPVLGYLVIKHKFTAAFGLFLVAGLSDLVIVNGKL